jgi:hypothetical protein
MTYNHLQSQFCMKAGNVWCNLNLWSNVQLIFAITNCRVTMEPPFLCDTKEPWPVIYPRTLTFTTLNFECVWKQGIFKCNSYLWRAMYNWSLQLPNADEVVFICIIWHIRTMTYNHLQFKTCMKAVNVWWDPFLLLLLIAKIKCTFNIRRTLTVELVFCLNVRHDRNTEETMARGVHCIFCLRITCVHDPS